MRPSRLALLALVMVLSIIAAPPARAAVTWYEHYQRGLRLEANGDWQRAINEFHAAIREEPVPRRQARTYGANFIFDYDPYFHLAHCLVELDRPVPASEALRASYRAGVTSRETLEQLRQRIEKVAARKFGAAPTAAPASRLAVSSDPPGAAVSVDGTPFGITPTDAIAIPPGEHAVRVELSGYRVEETTVKVPAGETSNLTVPLAALPTPTSPPTPVPTVAPRPTRPILPHPTVAVVVAATPQPTAVFTSPPAPATAAPNAGFRPLALPPAPPAAQRLLVPGLIGLAILLAATGGALWRQHRRAKQTLTAPTHLIAGGGTTRLEGTGTMGNYEVMGTLGRGGMATTYRARRMQDGTLVALKVPHDLCLDEPTFVARFLREGRLGEQLHHPCIVRIYEAGEAEGRPFLALELLSGHTLKQELREKGPLPLRRALEITRSIAEALDYAHAKGVVHRDLKPDNIMILPDGSLKVMDFGIARMAGTEGLTGTNFFLGTPLYAAPEMVDPKHIDHRVDLYALGIILYEMLEGAVPFSADSPYRVLEMHQRQPLPSREELRHPVPPQVWAIVTRLCAKNRDGRYPAAEVLLVELNRLLRDFSALEA